MKMGRPPIDVERRRCRTLKTYVPVLFSEQFNQRALLMGISVSDLLLRAAKRELAGSAKDAVHNV